VSPPDRLPKSIRGAPVPYRARPNADRPVPVLIAALAGCTAPSAHDRALSTLLAVESGRSESGAARALSTPSPGTRRLRSRCGIVGEAMFCD